MEKIVELIQNPWIVAIGSSVISGVLVYIITERFLKHDQNKEKAKKIESANMEIISILTRCIVEGELLKPEAVRSVLKSACRKYGVKEREVFSLEEIGEELLNDILKTPYISVKQKEEYVEKMNRYQIDVKSIEKQTTKEIKNEVFVNKRENDEYKELSAIMATITSIIPLIIMSIVFENYSINFKNYEIILSIATMTLFFSVMLVMIVYKKMLMKRKKKFYEKVKQREMIDYIVKTIK